MKILLPILLSLAAVVAHAQPVTVRGMASCSQWSEARASKDASATQMQIWALGYLSGVAMSLNKNALADTPPEDLYRAVDTHCKANPKNNLDMAATALFADLVKRKGL